MTIWSLEQENDRFDLTLFVSCFNEEQLIYPTLKAATDCLSEMDFTWEIIVIDDHSTDRSAARIEAFGRDHPQVEMTLLVNERNRGLAFNFVEAAYVGRGTHYRMMCGDNAEPKEALSAIFRHLGRAQMVVPFQVSSGRTLFRRALSRCFVLLVNLISGYRLRYYNGSPVFLRRHVIRWHPHSYGFGFQADLITRLLDEGCSYVQVEAWSTENKVNLSTALTLRNFLSVGHTLLEIAIRTARKLLYGREEHLR